MAQQNEIHQLYARALQDNTVLAQQLALAVSERDQLRVGYYMVLWGFFWLSTRPLLLLFGGRGGVSAYRAAKAAHRHRRGVRRQKLVAFVLSGGFLL